jgi:hypothetical protein
VFQKELGGNLTPVHRKEERRLPDHVTDTQAPAKVRSRQIGIFIVYLKQVEAHVEQQGTGIFSINFELCHGVDFSSIDVKLLVVDYPLE